MRSFAKYIIVGFVIVFFTIAFTTTHNIQSINDISYVVAIGIDVGEQDTLKVTFQFTKPSASGGESGASETASSIINSVEASSIDNAINLMNAYTSREMNLSHCKLLVFSEELARRGIKEEIYSLTNKVQIRPDTNIVISTSTAKKYIDSVKPSLENLISEFYALLPSSSEYTGYTVNVELGDFMNKIASQTAQPIAILGNIIDKNSNSGSSTESSNGNQEGSGSSNQNEKNGVENIGIAVFKHDRLIGTLSADETLCYLITTGEVKSSNISVPDPENEDNTIDLFFTFDSSPKINVSIINGTPFVTLKVKTYARISSVEQISGNSSDTEAREIEMSASSYLSNQISNYLYRTSKELNSDISNIGKYSLKEFKTLPEFEDYEWLERYQDAFFKVDCEVIVESGFLIVGS